MAKVKWDHENTTIKQRMIGVFSFAIMLVILGILLFIIAIKLFSPIQATFILSIIVAGELLAEAWNKWSPWAPSEED